MLPNDLPISTKPVIPFTTFTAFIGLDCIDVNLIEFVELLQTNGATDFVISPNELRMLSNFLIVSSLFNPLTRNNITRTIFAYNICKLFLKSRVLFLHLSNLQKLASVCNESVARANL